MESQVLPDNLTNTVLKAVPVSIVVLTRNEEVNVDLCLRSVSWAFEVFVVDSCSTDRTAEIAERLGAKVFVHPFEGYAKQRNWALDNLPFSNEWVLMLDADEQVPQPLADEIATVLNNKSQKYDGFYIKRRFFFLGKWLKHGGLYPTWILRLFKRHCVRFEERPVNEHAILDGTVGYLEQPFDHRDQKLLSDWISKHNRYADLEAEEFLQEKQTGGYDSSIEVKVWGSQAERKRWVKLKVWNRLPLLARPSLFFVRNYFLKLGFLDGRPGLIYQIMWSFWVRFLIDVKIFERQIEHGSPGVGARKTANNSSRPFVVSTSGLEKEGVRGHAGN